MLNERCLHKIDECISQIRYNSPEIPDWVSTYEKHHRYRLANDLMMVNKWASTTSRILEVGSAPFILTLALKKMGYRVVGVDINPDRFSSVIANFNLDVLRLDIEREPLPIPDKTFDLILFNEVFEHLRINPIVTMTEMRRVLKPQGRMYLSTPNLRSLRGIWMLIFKHKGGHVRPDIYDEYNKIELFGHMGHVREYTNREVSSFLEKVGFETKKTIFRFYDPIYQARSKAKILQIIEKTICRIAPNLKPLFTIVCVRGENDKSGIS